MITGFNTDVEHEGVVYHVQTEDKGLETPFILSLVYVGGAILASKRSPYTDLLGEKFDADALGERLQRQHKLICAAITSGRIEELKRLNRRENEALSASVKGARRRAETPAPVHAEAVSTPPPPPPPQVEARAPVPPPAAASTITPGEVREDVAAANLQVEATPERAAAPPPAETVAVPVDVEQDAIHVSAPPFADVQIETADERELIPVEADGALYVNLMEERDYRAGEIVTLRVRVSRGPIDSREAVTDAAVTVKVLGTEFRPLILTSKTDQDGVAVVHAWLPRFTSGRAAILVRASSDGYAAELRRAVRHS